MYILVNLFNIIELECLFLLADTFIEQGFLFIYSGLGLKLFSYFRPSKALMFNQQNWVRCQKWSFQSYSSQTFFQMIKKKLLFSMSMSFILNKKILAFLYPNHGWHFMYKFKRFLVTVTHNIFHANLLYCSRLSISK